MSWQNGGRAEEVRTLSELADVSLRGTPGGYRDPWDSDDVARVHAAQQRVRDAILLLHRETPMAAGEPSTRSHEAP